MDLGWSVQVLGFFFFLGGGGVRALEAHGVGNFGCYVNSLEAGFPDRREDPKSRSLNGGPYKVPLVV